jgi:uncharacterized protein (UPF0261 family)
MGRIFVVGTADTKGEELAYLRAAVAEAGRAPIVVDVGSGPPRCDVDIARSEVPAHHPAGAIFWAAPIAARRWRQWERRSPALCRPAATSMPCSESAAEATEPSLSPRACNRFGLPKADGFNARRRRCRTLCRCRGHIDLAGLNNISRTVLRDAAFGIVGMASAGPAAGTGKPPIVLTMFGVTTPCVTAITEQLRGRFDCIVFHATGTGGRAMEKLADSAFLYGVIDVTTTEVCDHLLGGVPARIGSARLRALDMVNFCAINTVPAQYAGRKLQRHNPQVTLMRTTAAESRHFGCREAQSLRRPGPLPHP